VGVIGSFMSDSLSRAVNAAVEASLEKLVDWDAGFGTTVRSSGQVVVGDVRNTIDTGRTLESVITTVTDDKVVINFPDDSASSIFNRRDQIAEVIIEELLGNAAAAVVEHLLNNR
jgi:hypothetical protein